MAIIWGFGLLLLVALLALFSTLVFKAGQARRAARTENCRYCGNPALHVSTPDQWIDPLLAHWNCLPHRCEVCYRRQHRYVAEWPAAGG